MSVESALLRHTATNDGDSGDDEDLVMTRPPLPPPLSTKAEFKQIEEVHATNAEPLETPNSLLDTKHEHEAMEGGKRLLATSGSTGLPISSPSNSETDWERISQASVMVDGMSSIYSAGSEKKTTTTTTTTTTTKTLMMTEEVVEVLEDESIISTSGTLSKPQSQSTIVENKTDSMAIVVEETTNKETNNSNNNNASKSTLSAIAASSAIRAATPVLHARQESVPRISAPPTHAKGFVNSKEVLQVTQLNITSGEIPKWIQGDLFTVGPGIFDVSYTRQGENGSETRYYSFGHWFDTIPLVQKLEIDGRRNAVHYRSRITARKLESKIRENGGYQPDRPGTLFRSDTNQSFFAGLLRSAPKKPKADAEACGAMIHTRFPLFGQTEFIYTQNQSNLIQQLDPRDLTPKKIFSWEMLNPAFKGAQATPHSRFDTRTGELFTITMDVGYNSTDYHCIALSTRDGKSAGQKIFTVNHPRPSLVHSFAITPRYIILVIFPFFGNMSGIKYYWGSSLLDSLTYYPEEKTTFYVISRAERQLIGSYKADACFSLHHVNAFEDEIDGIQVDMICYEDDAITRHLVLENLRNPERASQLPVGEVRRYDLMRLGEERTRITVLAPGAYQASPCYYDRMLDACMELPCVNPRYIGSSYRYVYGVSTSLVASNRAGSLWDTIVKADLDGRITSAFWQRPNCYPSEPIFVPNRHVDVDRTEVFISEQEDDGVLLTIVYDASRHTSSLVIIDASNMIELVSINLPQPIIPSFGHGSFLDAHAPP
ncbi:retinal pigment epithelial membrane protein-domain-containing protein [Syncephalis fuscata]|nr:retinal pigment epithelial membrane protein-domain-containing protein [Syncephalis fuscata]